MFQAFINSNSFICTNLLQGVFLFLTHSTGEGIKAKHPKNSNEINLVKLLKTLKPC